MTGLSIASALPQAADRWPERAAFRFRGDVLSYVDLRQKALAMAACLVDAGVRPGDRVGIAMTKGLEMPVAVHGIWMAGAAFVPLDPSAPTDRLVGIIEDCRISLVISADRNRKLAETLAAVCQITLVGTQVDGAPCASVQECAPTFTPVANEPDDLAYIIFTSGTTGQPKGICHTHSSGTAFAKAWLAHYALRKDDVFFCTVPLHFDFSLADFLTPAFVGATTELVPEQVLLFPASLAELLERCGGTIWSSVPYTFLQLCERGATVIRDLSSLRWLIYGGEPLPPSALPLLRQTFGAEISNSYGPAEVNQVSQYTVPLDHLADQAVPIGDPLPGCDFWRAQDGELLVSAPSMMQGYWNRPDLDADAFVERDGRRHYRTGDRVERTDDGLWVFMGRADRQIKVRGYRIELDEIEMAMAAVATVSEAAAVVSPDGLRLHAFVTLVPGATAEPGDIQADLALRLPRYAVPERIDIRRAFLKTSTGKINRRVLREEAE